MTVQTPEGTVTAPEDANAPKVEEKAGPDWKAEARKWEARAKENSTAAQRLAEIEAANQTEAEKIAARAAAAEERAAQAELRALRLEIAAEKGLTAAQAKRLVGTKREELEADADELLETFKPAAVAPVTPKADPSQGARGATTSLGREAGIAEAERRFGKSTK